MLTESCVMFFRRPVLFEALFCEMNIWPRRLVLTEGGLPVVGQHWPCLVPRSCTQTSLCRWKCARAKVAHSLSVYYVHGIFLFLDYWSAVSGVRHEQPIRSSRTITLQGHKNKNAQKLRYYYKWSFFSTAIFYFCFKKDMAEQTVRDLVRKLKVLLFIFCNCEKHICCRSCRL